MGCQNQKIILSLILFFLLPFVGYSHDAQLEKLINNLKDEDWHVRWEAAEALVEIKNPKSVELLIDTLKYGQENAQVLAAWILGKMEDSRAVEPLIEALGNEHPYIRKSAALALMEIGKPAVEPLIEALKNEEANTRREAAFALGLIKDT